VSSGRVRGGVVGGEQPGGGAGETGRKEEQVLARRDGGRSGRN
jgi:hypothetical protein